MVVQIRDVVARSAPCNYKGSRLDPICRWELLPGVGGGVGSTMAQPDIGNKGHSLLKLRLLMRRRSASGVHGFVGSDIGKVNLIMCPVHTGRLLIRKD